MIRLSSPRIAARDRAAMAGRRRRAQDWTPEGKTDIAFEVLDLLPPPADPGACPFSGDRFAAGDNPKHTGWIAWQLGVDNSFDQTRLRAQILGTLVQAGLARRLRPCWENATGPLYWCLAVDRHQAHEQWAELAADWRRRGRRHPRLVPRPTETSAASTGSCRCGGGCTA
jgi:hypothetical protein